MIRTLKRFGLSLVFLALSFAGLGVPTGSADFGFQPGSDGFDVSATNQNGSTANQAGSHPFQYTTSLGFNTTTCRGCAGGDSVLIPDGDLRDAHVNLPPGLFGNPTAVAECTRAQFHTPGAHPLSGESCPDDSQVGTVAAEFDASGTGTRGVFYAGVFNLVPPPGRPAQLGSSPAGIPVTLTPHVRDGDYGLTIDSLNTTQLQRIYGIVVTIWGSPWDSSHDLLRGVCMDNLGVHDPAGPASCPISSDSGTPQAYLTLPTSCAGPLQNTIVADSWQSSGAYLPDGEPDLSDPRWASASMLSHDILGNPIGIEGCNHLAFASTLAAAPTSDRASAPTGLDFSLDINDEGLTNPAGNAQSQIKKTVATLPEGMSINPSAGEGLGVCTPTQYRAETASSPPGAGCPNSSKVGSVSIDTPLLKEPVDGAVYIAQQNDPRTKAPGAENPFDSLLALYMVAKTPDRGVIVKMAGKVTPNEKTGQLVTTFDNLPQLPFSHFNLHLREGQRSPLISPSVCGVYTVDADLYPWSNPSQVLHDTADFTVTKGFDGGPCPPGATPPFHPGLLAGTINNRAGSFSPFYVRMDRTDGEQEITHFSIKLPPGVIGKLAGIPFCSDAAIETAKTKTGTEESQSPSCPKASEVGHTLVGTGVGSVLAYAPGKLYLAGPYHGSALSIAAITSATVGPFDLGTVVVRQALKINPETGEVFIDATGSDPIPHIVDGIPTHLRDIRAYVDRPEFVLNPTNCDRTSTASTVLGSGLDFASEADDRPVTVSSPFQAADCAALPFKPKLSLKLKGGTNRGAHPALKAILKMNGIGEAGVRKAQVTLPASEFIENAHFKTICTRVVFKQGAHPGEECPSGSIYGYAKAITPILSDPLTGSVFLRSSEHQLPDVVASLHNGEIDVVLVGRVDSVKGRLRNTFEATPDAPVSSVQVSLFGGKKGLFVNSTNLCKGIHKAEANFTGHNGKEWNKKPEVVAVGCKGKAAKKHKRRAK